jgi:hypothetical protein
MGKNGVRVEAYSAQRVSKSTRNTNNLEIFSARFLLVALFRR